ncbi:hypothetical protein [Caudoviricetes sp.]|nr:hypothetical protein [Caudoviricetes sp.]UOF79155.1 hypothetical protein [Caudoviricetes sp.]
MAVTVGSKVVRFTADNDVHDFGGQKVKVKGVRLVTAAADSTAQIKLNNTNGDIIYSLTALAKTSDESNICTTLDATIIHVDLSGAGAEVFLYVE